MTLESSMLTAVFVFIIGGLLFAVFLALWTYTDAKVKSEQPPFLWVLVVLLVPNFVGIVIYLLFGRQKTEQPAPGSFKTPLITSGIVAAVSFVFLLVSAVVLTVLNIPLQNLQISFGNFVVFGGL
ncbi:MAG: PLDc N-terminal domain-containing protein [Defluviitaleaceae bacterium]|nr:PLDc N-terminal domain-containing protein [Defluviitaleaceae bacterium]